MLVVISPAKKMDESPDTPVKTKTESVLMDKTSELMKRLKKLEPAQIQKLMKLSNDLTNLNFNRFQSFKKPTVKKQAMYLFAGDTYTGLQAQSMKGKTIDRAQNKLRILSGLYGILKPLDEIVPYRLEMGVGLDIKDKKNLYQWWQTEVTDQVNKDLESHGYLANLASNEYFKAINHKKLIKPVINFKFLDLKNGEYKLISFNAKKARGAMAREILEKDITDPKELTKISVDGYHYNEQMSEQLNFTFTRG